METSITSNGNSLDSSGTPATFPLVYIVLLNWHGWWDTIACLDSLARLNYPSYHILVVDNGSTDDSVARIRDARPEVPILETGKNLGFSGGCNVGIRQAIVEGADYVWLLNNDTVADPNALQAMVEVAESASDIGAVGSVLYYMDEPNKVQAWGGGWVSFWTGRAGHHYGPVRNTSLDYLTAASILLRRSALETVGLLDQEIFFMYWEDTDLSFRLSKSGWKLTVADQSKVFHKVSASFGKDSPRMDTYFNESAVQFFRRYSPWPIWSISIALVGRLTKRALRGNSRGFVATLRGAYAGWRKRQ